MGHGHHHQEIKIPDFRQYKVEEVPLLMETKRRLASLGLSDPWLRNEVWKYKIRDVNPTSLRALFGLYSTGFKYGVVIALVATAISKTFARKHEHH